MICRVLPLALVLVLSARAGEAKDRLSPIEAYRQCVFSAAMHYLYPATKAPDIATASVTACESQAEALRDSWSSLTPQDQEAALRGAKQNAYEVALKAAEAMHKSRRGM